MSSHVRNNWHPKDQGITRNASSPVAQALSTQGIEVVIIDQDDRSSLVPASSVAEVIFALTNFWEPLYKKHEDLSKQGDQITCNYAAAIKIHRGKAIVNATTKDLQGEGKLERFFGSTLPSFKGLIKGKYSYVYHFDVEAEVSTCFQQEHNDFWEKKFTVKERDKTRPGGFGREAAQSTACSAEFGWGNSVLPEDLGSDFKFTGLKEYSESEE
ncbi:hypothetical protein BOTCAL_0667g00020 [Botryotinia calthae]|uniref:NmrA-like domain-containing protein n=1 Tax=Botryotinia calthae TaxID=38488 RepID=A0A4Y8CI55_9HELO|nr:hypothetical protein BOTCAL_0667g00020 [Botryotinia calthae]